MTGEKVKVNWKWERKRGKNREKCLEECACVECEGTREKKKRRVTGMGMREE